MAFTIPLLPTEVPHPDPPFSTAPLGQCLIWFFQLKDGVWLQPPDLTLGPWDAYPWGWLVAPSTNFYAGSLTVILARTRPDGTLAPNVLLQPGEQEPTDPPSPPPVQAPTCPDGYFLDPQTEYCAPLFTIQNPPPIPVPPPPGPPPPNPPPPNPPPPPPNPPPPPPPPPIPGEPQPCVPPPSGDGDELTDGLNCISQNLLVIQSQLAKLVLSLTGPQPGNPDPVTCAQLSNLVVHVNATLTVMARSLAQLAAAPGTTVDLAPIVEQLTRLATSAALYPPIAQAAAQMIGGKLDGIATAISDSGGADTEGIVQQLKVIADQGDVPQPALDALEQLGFLNGDDLQQLQGAPWSKVLSWIEATKAFRSLEKYMRTVGAKPPTLGTDITAAPSPTIDWATAKITGALTTERNFIQDLITPILAKVRTALTPAGGTQIDVIGVNPDTVLADVAAVGLNLKVLATVVGIVFPGAAEGLEHVTELAVGLLGLEELREVQLGPLVRFGIARVAEMQAKATFKQEIPGTTALQGLVAQGLLDRTRARAIVQFNGTPDELEPLMQQSAYTGLGSRRVLRLIETGLFSDAEIADELTFAGMRPVSQHRMLVAAPYLASASARSALQSTAESAYVAGLLSDQDLTNQLDAAKHDTDRNSLSLARARLQKLIAHTKELEAEYTTLFTGGLMSDDLFRANLAAIGLQPDTVNIIAGKAEARANATLQRKTLAAEAALERATEAKAREAAMESFKTGTIDAAGLTAALSLTGLTAPQVAAMVSLAVLRLGGALRWQYGLQLSPQAATLLHARVTALSDQRKRLLITDPQFVDGLAALGIPPREINALRAAADAMLSPKSSAVVVPVRTD